MVVLRYFYGRRIMQTKNYDPKLREAMDKIQEVADKYDIGFTAMLFSQEHAEFKFHLEPSWSQMKFNRQADGTVKGFKFKYRTRKAKQCDATAAMIGHIKDLSALFFSWADGAFKELQKGMEIEHVPFGGGISVDDLPVPGATVISIPGMMKKE